MMSRRTFLQLSAAYAAAVASPLVLGAPRYYGALWLKRDDTELRINYLTPTGQLNAQHYKAACWMLRDVRLNKVGFVSLRLLETVSWMQTYLTQHHIQHPFLVHSGLRMPSTNKMAEGARASMHLPDERGYFRAMDISMDAVDSKHLAALAAYAHQGGIGFYPGKNFIHVDTGNIRYWKG